MRDGSKNQRGRLGGVSPRLMVVLAGVALAVGGLVAIIMLVVKPSFSSPTSRMYASSLGYPAKMRKKGAAIRIRSVLAEERTFSRTISATGSMGYNREVPVRSELTGIVGAVMVKEGDAVKRGDLLLKLQTSSSPVKVAQLDMERSKYLLDQAESDYEREKQAFENDSISQTQLEAFVKARDLARLEYDKAKEIFLSKKESLSTKVLSSPTKEDDGATGTSYPIDIRSLVDGTVARVNMEVGENLVNVSSGLMTIGDRLVFKATVDQQYAGAVKVGDVAELFLQAYPGRPLVGAVSRIDPTVTTRRSPSGQAEPYTYLVLLDVALPDEQTLLMAGMNGYCVFDRTITEVGVPQSAVVRYSGRQALVMVVDADQRIELRKVSFVAADKGSVAISRGLRVGERVIIEGQVALQEGDQVDVSE